MKTNKLKTIAARNRVLPDNTRKTKYTKLISEIEVLGLGGTITISKTARTIVREMKNVTDALYRRKDTMKIPKGH